MFLMFSMSMVNGQWSKVAKVIGFGTFDGLHPGHLSYLKQLSAKSSYETPRLCSPTTTRLGRNAASSTAIVFKGWAAPHINTSNAANPFSGQV